MHAPFAVELEWQCKRWTPACIKGGNLIVRIRRFEIRADEHFDDLTRSDPLRAHAAELCNTRRTDIQTRMGRRVYACADQPRVTHEKSIGAAATDIHLTAD